MERGYIGRNQFPFMWCFGRSYVNIFMLCVVMIKINLDISP